MTPQLKNFAATRNTPIHQTKKISKINETIIDSSLNFPVFDHSYLLKTKKNFQWSKAQYQQLTDTQVFHNNPLLKEILSLRLSNGGLHQLKAV